MVNKTQLQSEGPEIGPLEQAGLDPAEAKGTRKLEIDLSNPRDGEEFIYSGDILAVQKLDGSAEVKFTRSEDYVSLNAFPGLSRRAGFNRFFVKNEAQPGKELIVQIGGQAGVSLQGIRSNVAVVDTNDVQIDPARQKGWPNLAYGQDKAESPGEVILNDGTSLVIPHGASLSVKAFSDNTGLIYLGDKDGVSENTGYPLSVGESKKIHVTDVSHVAFYAPNADDGVAWIVETD